MKKLFSFTALVLLLSCKSEEITIKDIISEGTYKRYSINKIKDAKILKEDISPMVFHYSLLGSSKENHTYYLVRYIFKTDDGAYRMFYVIDYTDKVIVDQSRHAEDFYYIYEGVFKENAHKYFEIFKGDNTFDLMRY